MGDVRTLRAVQTPTRSTVARFGQRAQNDGLGQCRRPSSDTERVTGRAISDVAGNLRYLFAVVRCNDGRDYRTRLCVLSLRTGQRRWPIAALWPTVRNGPALAEVAAPLPALCGESRGPSWSPRAETRIWVNEIRVLDAFACVTVTDPRTRFVSKSLDPGEMQRRLHRALIARFGMDLGSDAAAEACAYAVEHADRLNGMENPIGYLYRLGERYGRRRNIVSRRTALLVDGAMADARHIDIDLQRALMRLTPHHRVAVVLTLAHGHTYQEAADLLDVPVTTVTNHVTRGRARLKELLENQ